MLESISLRNFQRHAKKVVAIGPGVTCIVGPTDAGKSAILRALRWLFFNRPRGSSFQRRGSKFVRVAAQVDGRKVTRKKGKSSGYFIDGKPFRAVKTEVPEEIANLLNVSDANYQSQHDAPFWFSKSAPQVAKELNKIINLDDIDRSLADVAKQLRDAESRYKVVRDRRRIYKAHVQELKWVPAMARELVQLNKLETRTVDLDNACEDLGERLELIATKQAQVKDVPDFSPVRMVKKRLDEQDEQIESLREILRLIKQKENEQCELAKEIKTARKQLAAVRPKVCPTCGKEMT